MRKSHKATYCSTGCRNLHHNLKRRELVRLKQTEQVKFCARCNKPFTYQQKTGKYCSKNCSDIHWAYRKRRKIGIDKRDQWKTCAVCDEQFLSKRSNQLFCSKRCQRVDARIKKHGSESKLTIPQWLIRKRAEAIQRGWSNKTKWDRKVFKEGIYFENRTPTAGGTIHGFSWAECPEEAFYPI